MVHVIVFATALTSFIQFNTVIGSTEGEISVKTSQAFNLDSSIQSTDRVYYTTSTSSQKLLPKMKVVTKNIPAIQIGQKLLVIKGYSEDSANVLSALEQENIELPQLGSSSSEEFIPTTVAVTVSEEEGTVVLDQEGDISEYEVVGGDTIEQIARKYNITPETILWANDLKKNGPINVGQKLVILPVSGISYTIRSGDTISEISEKFHVSQKELTEFNNLEDGKLMSGSIIIIPGGKILATDTPKGSTNTPKNTPVKSNTTENTLGYFSKPVVNAVKTQGIHGHNGVDFASAYGTPILSAREGYVSLVRGGNGWNGGYGNYVVVTHEKGIQTLYAHMSDIKVVQGQQLARGQQVGSMGSTGESTGVHLHFEVRGAKNPF